MQDVLSHISANDVFESIVAMERRFLSLYNIQKCSVGFEYEFYCLSKPTPEFLAELQAIDIVQDLKPELGHWQFELVTSPHNSFIEACDAMYWIKQSLTTLAKKHQIMISQQAITFSSDNPPSSMQASICMYDSKGNALNSSSRHFIKAVQSLVHNLYNATMLTCPTKNCYARLTNIAIAKEFKNSPTHINWGIENRTLAIRLASIYNNSNGQRIEYRTPSSMANPYYVAIAMLTSLLSISNIEYPQTFVDAWESHSERLPQSINEAYTAFVKSPIFHMINTFSYQYAI
jgi:glutamine synthetase